MASKRGRKRALRRGVSVVSAPEGATVDPLTLPGVAAQSKQQGGIHIGVPPVTYNTLLQVARSPVVASIIATRQNQVVDYAQRLRTQHMNGWSIQLREPHAIPSRTDRYRMDMIATIIENAGGKYGTGGFETFLRGITYNTLSLDQAHIQPIMSKAQRPVGYRLLDPTTIRRELPITDIPRDGNLDIASLPSAQYINMKKVAQFSPGEISWSTRNTLPNVHTFGYGFPELAMLLGVVAALIQAQTHNAKIYSTGYHGSNMVAIKSLMGPERFKTLENSIQAMLTGVRKNKSVPIVQLNPNLNEELTVLPFGKPPADMEFMNWINWLVKLICSLYGMDPLELGFVFGDEQGKQKNKSDLSPQDRIVASKERSLRPLLRWIARQINETIIWPYWPEYQLEFYGFDSISESQKLENFIKSVQNFMSVNEVRAAYNLPPWKDPVSNRPLNASYQMYHQKLVEQGISVNADIIADDVAAFVGGRRMNPPTTPA